MTAFNREYFAELLNEEKYQEVLELLSQPDAKAALGSSSVALFQGVALQNLGELDHAVEAYEAGAQSTLNDLLLIWNNLAGALYHKKQFSEAAKIAEQLRTYSPFDLEMLSLHILSLQGSGQSKEAEQEARNAMSMLQRSPAAARWLTHILWRNNRYLEALLTASDIPLSEWQGAGMGYELFHCLLELGLVDVAEQFLPICFGNNWASMPTEEAWAGVSLLAFHKKDLVAANRLYKQGLERGYDHSGSIMTLAFGLLTRGEFAEGWKFYLARNDELVLHVSQVCHGVPRWNGEPIQGKTLLIVSEQGIGDVIQFLRFVPEMEVMGARLIFSAYPDVVGLLANDPEAKKIEMAPLALSDVDFQARLLDLPLYLGIKTPSDVPKCIPYLFAKPAKVAEWGSFFAADMGLKVGLVWAGNPAHGSDAFRSASINIFAPLSGIPDVTFYGLQKGAGIKEAKMPPEGLAYQWIGDLFSNFDDTAAAIANLDLVICVDTSVAHLAAAMGKPVWMLAALRNGEWRWTDHGNGNAWYPNLRVFFQEKPDDWLGLIKNAIRPALADFVLSVGHGKLPWAKMLLEIDSSRNSAKDLDWDCLAIDVARNGYTTTFLDWCWRWLKEEGQYKQILALCSRWTRDSSPDSSALFEQLRAYALRLSGARDEAIAEWSRMACSPEIKELSLSRRTYTEWGQACVENKSLLNAVEIWSQGLNKYPLDGHLHYLIGNAHRELLNKKEAKEYLLKALELSPRHEPAHLAFWLLMKADSPVEALDHLQKVVMQNINNSSAWRQIAVCFQERGLLNLAHAVLKSKCNIKSDNSVRLEYIQYMMFGGDVSGARVLFETLKMNDNASMGDQRLHAHLAYWLISPEVGIEEMARLVTLYPEERVCHAGLGHNLLRLGRSEMGWQHYWQGMSREALRLAEWSGQPLQGKTILITQDQGVGDCIQFFPLLMKLFEKSPRRMVVAVNKGLVTLMKSQGVPFEVVDAKGFVWDEFRFDYQVEFMALPYLFKVDLLKPDVKQPTLQSMPGVLSDWDDHLQQDDSFKIGIVWAGGAALKHDYLRSSTLADWRRLWDVDGVSMYSLQKDDPSNQAAYFDLPLVNIAADCPTWAQTMAAIEKMDLIVTVDTAVAHVAASLNKPTWILLSDRHTDFRWLLERDDCPWYPSVKLFRRAFAEPWSDVLGRVAVAVRETLVLDRQKPN